MAGIIKTPNWSKVRLHLSEFFIPIVCIIRVIVIQIHVRGQQECENGTSEFLIYFFQFFDTVHRMFEIWEKLSGSSRLYRLDVSLAQKCFGRWAPAASRSIAYAPNFPFFLRTKTIPQRTQSRTCQPIVIDCSVRFITFTPSGFSAGAVKKQKCGVLPNTIGNSIVSSLAAHFDISSLNFWNKAEHIWIKC